MSNIALIKRLSDKVEKLEGDLARERAKPEQNLERIKELKAALVEQRDVLQGVLDDPSVLERLHDHIAKLAKTDFTKLHTDEIVKLLEKLIAKDLVLPKSLHIDNLEDIQFPSAVNVNGFKAFTKTVALISKRIKEFGNKVFKASVTGSVSITNRDPEDAIPVVLASEDRRRLYNALFSTSVQGSGGLSTEVSTLQMIAAGALGTWYDHVDVTYPTSSTEQYVFKLNSATVRTILLTYSDSSKTQLTTVART